jgi:hypothetical protein
MFHPRLLAVAVMSLAPAVADAGMPSLTLTDVARIRLENISFFLVVFLLAALCIKLIWNYLAKDWTFLPRLSYPRALGLTTLWGLLFILVLTMISGARELMTPGAWEKQGATYRLAKTDAERSAEDAVRDAKRRQQLELLRAALWEYAVANQGAFPSASTDPAIPAELWKLPDSSGLQYLYRAGNLSRDERLVAYEPELYANGRMALLASGEIRLVNEETLEAMLPAEERLEKTETNKAGE